MAQPNRQPTSVSLSLLRSSLISRTQMQRRRMPPSFTQAQCCRISSLLHRGAAPPHLAPPCLLPHGSRRYSAARPPSCCSWLCALSLPSAPSLPLAAAPSDPPSQSTTASVADDPGGVGFGGDERGGSCMAFPYRFSSSLHGYLATFG